MLPHVEEVEVRRNMAEKLALPRDVGWDTILRSYQCRFHGLEEHVTWQEVWRTVWSRYIGYVGLSERQLAREVTARWEEIRFDSDPCLGLANNGTLRGVGLSVDKANVCNGLQTTLVAIKQDYALWRKQVLGV